VSISAQSAYAGGVLVLLTAVFTAPMAASHSAEAARHKPHCTIAGNHKHNILYGTPGRDVICGRGGADWVWARGANDVVRGGIGNDLMWGATGHDRMFGGLGDDQLVGERGDDRLSGRRGNDTLYDPTGVDTYIGGPGSDCIESRDDRRPARQRVERALGGLGTDSAYADKADALRNVEDKHGDPCDIENIIIN
jgi:Ca2+-binding RTX toxin-like protein